MSFRFEIFIIVFYSFCMIFRPIITLKARNDEGQCLIYRNINWQIINYFQYKQQFLSLTERKRQQQQ